MSEGRDFHYTAGTTWKMQKILDLGYLKIVVLTRLTHSDDFHLPSIMMTLKAMSKF